MIKSITVTNPRGNSLVINLADPYKTGLVIQNINGLGPVEADIQMSDVSTTDGAIFNSARKSSRVIDISFLFDMWSSLSIEQIRHELYVYFPTKRKVQLKIETETRVLTTEGYVERCDPTYFADLVGADVTIRCPDPYLYAEGEGQETVFSVEDPLFEFPFTDEPTPSLVFSSLDIYSTRLIVYEGDADVGVTISIHALGAANHLTIFNYQTGEFIAIDTDKLAALTGNGIIAGDDIVIETTRGHKSITLTRSGVSTNILNCMSRDSDWLRLEPGDNVFVYTTDPSSDSSNLQIRINNKIAYDGV